jgi:hypothetical protein
VRNVRLGLGPTLALAVVLLYAAASGVGWVKRAAAARARPAIDDISQYERRFEGLRSALPRRGTIGYVGSPEPTPWTPGVENPTALQHFRRYLLAQYTLAPLLLVKRTDPDLVIGNFEPGQVPPPPEGFVLDKDFGNGIVLFRRAPQ